MAYVLVGIIVLLLVGAFVTYLVMQATRRSSPATERDPAADREDEGAAGIGADATPLGDTAEHAGQTSASGETVGGQDAERSGGTGHPIGGEKSVRSAGEPAAPEPDRRFQRDPVGGEAEARPFTPGEH